MTASAQPEDPAEVADWMTYRLTNRNDSCPTHPSLDNSPWNSSLHTSWSHCLNSTAHLHTGLSNNSQPEGPSLSELLEEVATFRAAMTLVRWLLPLVVLVGVVGNAVSLFVLLRRGMRRTSACRYLACLAVADTAVLLASALKTWVRVVWGFELLHTSQVSCKLLIFTTHLSLTAAAWLIVAVTAERFLVVWMPLRSTEVCNVARSRVVMAGILVALACINSHVFWTAELVPVSPQRSLSPSGVQCASYAYRTLACQVFPWVHLAMYCFLPAVLLLCLNTLILYKLFQHRQAITANQDSRSSRSSSNNRNIYTANGHDYYKNHPHPIMPRNRSQTKLLLQQQGPPSRRSSSHTPQHFHRRLAPMLLGVSFCWILLTTPQTIYALAAPRPQDLEDLGKQYLIKTLCFLLMYLNHALNFFLYCLTGQRFRQELRRGLNCSGSDKDLRLRQVLLIKWARNGLNKGSGPDAIEGKWAAQNGEQGKLVRQDEVEDAGDREVEDSWTSNKEAKNSDLDAQEEGTDGVQQAAVSLNRIDLDGHSTNHSIGHLALMEQNSSSQMDPASS
ncbi:thyrotropin-releasing hormone receptor-like isoform X2 [Littorina saxatilis]|uniref:G-protein coupled receptors family 1 profile domain-containing protein n=2 Tax=Littorina saxatilis TaxID=31220 RepID=A0AAN9C1P7_9CAEN